MLALPWVLKPQIKPLKENPGLIYSIPKKLLLWSSSFFEPSPPKGSQGWMEFIALAVLYWRLPFLAWFWYSELTRSLHRQGDVQKNAQKVTGRK